MLVFLLLPDDVHQMHGSFIQAVKEVPQRFSRILHTAQDEAEGDAEDQ